MHVALATTTKTATAERKLTKYVCLVVKEISLLSLSKESKYKKVGNQAGM